MSVAPLIAHPAVQPAYVFRGRIGRDARSGHYAVPGRYRLHVSVACPDGLRIAVAHGLLGLDESCPVTFLPAVPDCPDGGHTALRPLYEASAHRYPGPALAPVLSDDWSGRIVSTHARDIMRDLDRHFASGRPALYPCGADAAIEAVERLSDAIEEAAQRAGSADAGPGERAAALHALPAALGDAERLLARRGHVLDDQLTAADLELWVALVRLDTVHRHHLDAAAVQRVAGHSALWSYARRLAAHPAFGGPLDLHRAAHSGSQQADGR